MKKILIPALLLVIFFVQAQDYNPGEDEIFRNDEIATVILFMSEEDKAFMLADENILSEDYLPASFRFINSLMDTTLIFDVGIRLRGNTSRYHPKKSFKIKFKEFDGEKFYDLKKFNLKAENNDPTFVREMMSLRTFRNFNVPAARTHYAKVFINDEFMGLYLNVEQLDDEFVQSRFDYDEGNLYKCGWGATLESGNDLYNNDIFEIETNEDENDRSGLAHFVDVLNNTPDEEFEEAITEVFNVDVFLRYLAVEALVGHWDGYSYNQNNFYLYENNSNGLIEFMPYDVDNTFGMDWIGGDWGTHDVTNWAVDDRPLTNRILSVPNFYWQYIANLEELLSTYFSEAYYYPEFDFYASLLSAAVEEDAYFPQTFGFSHDDFVNGFTEQVVEHAPYGLKPYVTTRAEAAQEQVAKVTSKQTSISSTSILYPNPSNGQFVNVRNTASIQDEPIVYDVCGKEHHYTLGWNGEDGYQLRFEDKLAAGIYIVKTTDQQMKFLVK